MGRMAAVTPASKAAEAHSLCARHEPRALVPREQVLDEHQVVFPITGPGPFLWHHHFDALPFLVDCSIEELPPIGPDTDALGWGRRLVEPQPLKEGCHSACAWGMSSIPGLWCLAMACACAEKILYLVHDIVLQ